MQTQELNLGMKIFKTYNQNTSGGWVKLWRSLLYDPLFQSLKSKYRDVFIVCLLLANHKPKKFEWHNEMIEIQSGEFITSLESIKNVCAKDVNIQSIRTALTKFEKWGFITNKSTNHGRLIKINKWEKYQGKIEEAEQNQICLKTKTNKQFNKQLTSNQQTTNKQLTTNKNNKNIKNANINKANHKKLSEKEFTKEVQKHTEYKEYWTNFINYWTEKTPQGIMRFQKENFFEIKKRLRRFGPPNQTQEADTLAIPTDDEELW